MSQTTQPEIQRRGAPHQKRSQKTVDLILATAADLLEESGFENLSTNAICRRAGLTPPALYRYFPNKYAVLKELGERLMEQQNRVVFTLDWTVTDLETLQRQMADLLTKTIKVTRDTPAGVWILRALHATPALSDVRLNSHREIASLLSRQVLRQWPAIDPKLAMQSLRLGVELGYAMIEMVFDEPELDEAQLVETTADLLNQNLRRLIEA